MEDFNPRVDENNLQTINLSSSDDESGACGKCVNYYGTSLSLV